MVKVQMSPQAPMFALGPQLSGLLRRLVKLSGNGASLD